MGLGNPQIRNNNYYQTTKMMMKRIVMIALAVIASYGAVYSQSRMTEEEKQEAIARYREYVEELNLTEEQKPKVEEINKAYFDGLSKLRGSNASRMEKFQAFKQLRSERDNKMKDVLTKEQYAIYKEHQKEQRENFRERRRSR
jgi:Spy/CpxP family protein refolding chaperone